MKRNFVRHFLKKNYIYAMKRLFLFITTLLLVSCHNPDDDYVDPRGTDYAGAESCIQCHKSVGNDAMHSAHFKATAPALAENILGNFSDGHNTFHYGPDIKMVMEKRGDSLYQVLYKNDKLVKSYPFDIVFGHRKAQTAVYWHNKNTYELPISYYKADDVWGTSPGFSATEPYFDRMTIKDCYACHSSNASGKKGNATTSKPSFLTMEVEDIIDPETIVYGIDCERCHGPAKKHADYHEQFPKEKMAHFIASYKTLDNKQKLDACAICHSGSLGIKSKSRFGFQPGDRLEDYYRVPYANEYDVHGNQAGALSQSECFMQTGKMNCLTCHNPHQDTNGGLEKYAQICMGCHKSPPHPNLDITEAQLTENCINCHMPKQASKAINFKTSYDSKVSEYSLRTHRIAVYPESSTAK